MNYVKVFDIRQTFIEETLNPFFQELAEKNHRIMHVQFYFYADDLFHKTRVVIVVNDEPHPHKKL